MYKFKYAAFSVVCFLILPACQAQAIKSSLPNISGEIKVDHLLDSDKNQPTQLSITLEDSSIADSPAQALTEVKYYLYQINHKEPIQFSLPYHPETIKPNKQYTLSVSIFIKNNNGVFEERFLNTESIPVLTKQQTKPLSILLKDINPGQ